MSDQSARAANIGDAGQSKATRPIEPAGSASPGMVAWTPEPEPLAGQNPSPACQSILALDSQTFVAAARLAFGAPDALGRARGSGPALSIYRQFFRQGKVDWAATGLSDRSLSVWMSAFGWDVPARVAEVFSDLPGEQPGTEHLVAHSGKTTLPPGKSPGASLLSAAKAVLSLADGLQVEMVLIPMETGEGGRASLCVSSQAGCSMGCAFCETGRSGLLRSLTTAEIVAQVHLARFGLGWEFSNLVFMGMGEPLDNVESVLPALEVLMDPQGFAFAQERITLCTVGIPSGIAALAARGWKRLGLSLSLNAARQGLRESLMPVSRAWNLDTLATALAAYRPRPNFVLALNWCLLPGINNRPEDADGIAVFASRIGRVMVNVIPYNPGTTPLAAAPEPDEIDAFMDLLKARGIPARLRGPKGRSIMAACGQLGGKTGSGRE